MMKDHCFHLMFINVNNILIFVLLTALAEIITAKLLLFNRPCALKEIFVTDVSLFNYLSLSQYQNILLSDLIKSSKNKHSTWGCIKTALKQKSTNNLYRFLDNNSNRLSPNFKHRLDKIEGMLNHHTVYNTSRIFDGALIGVILLQYVYGLDVDNLVYEKLKGSNRKLFSTEKHQYLARLRISDTIILAARSIMVEWYDGAMSFLRLAKDMIEIENEWNLESLKLENTISGLISTANLRNLQQDADDYFERDTRLLPFITKR